MFIYILFVFIMHSCPNFMYITGLQVPAKTKVHWSPQVEFEVVEKCLMWAEMDWSPSPLQKQQMLETSVWHFQPLTHFRKELAILAGKVHID